MSQREIQFMAGLLVALVLWMILETLDIRLHLRGLYDELGELRSVQARCRLLRVVETSTETAEVREAEQGGGIEGSQPAAEIIDIPWRAPERRPAPGSGGAV